uniref:Uncharacterized protein n=1 Tax=Alexandrium monilatum TaxID=311494 RepID=A0A7S4RAK7_9DINO|mmetsp:Transcript_77658/g.231411  ORF Transcript_77658/g.231411 Transcript_77658/m.231411 type:complete len:240 (-) Transcript_77658:241-960(-)
MHTLVPSEASLLLAGDLVSRPLAERMRDVARKPSWIFVRRQLASYEAGGAVAACACRILEPVRLLAARAPAAALRLLAARRWARRGPPARRAARGRRSGRAAGVGTASNSRPARVVALESSGMVLVTSSGVLVAAASQTTWGTAGAGGGTRDVDGAAPRSGPCICQDAPSWPAAAVSRTTHDVLAAWRLTALPLPLRTEPHTSSTARQPRPCQPVPLPRPRAARALRASPREGAALPTS